MDVTTLLIAVMCLFIGLAAGALLTRALSPAQKKQRELEEQLRRAEDRHRLYQQDVTEHFVKSADLLRELSHNYRSLGEQLADGAMRLTTPEVSRQVLEASSPALASGALPFALDIPAEPPKDYAPSAPGGVLSEHFGLDEREERGEELLTRGIKPDEDGDEGADDDRDPTYRVG